MRVRTQIESGGIGTEPTGPSNYNQTLVRDPKGLKVKTRVKAGGTSSQHNETLVHDGKR